MVVLIVLLTIAVFVVVDLFLRMAVRRVNEARLKKERQEALEIGLKIVVAEEANSLKRVEVAKPKARILAVDDEPIILDSFRKILVLEGYSVDTVESGEEALGLVQKNEYDFVFTDLKMPGLDGVDVTKAVKHLRPDIDVIVITGYASIQTAVDVMKFGALDYVEKPFTEEELTAFVNKSLVRRQEKLEQLRPPKVHLVTASSPGADSERVYNVPAGVFLSSAHVWIRIELTGELRVGLDDFARKTIGEIDAVLMPRIGTRVMKGEPLFTIKQDGRTLAFPAPVSGEIAGVNEGLSAHPEHVKVNPYEIGWICLLHPENLAGDLEGLRIGAGATEWYEEEIERYVQMVKEHGDSDCESRTGGAVPDPAAPEASTPMSDELWDRFERSFFRERRL